MFAILVVFEFNNNSRRKVTLVTENVMFQKRHIDHAREFYETLVHQFPNCARYWRAYIEHEVSACCIHCLVRVELVGVHQVMHFESECW